MEKKHFFVVFIGILLLSIVVRVYNVSEIPPGVNRDEASIGYTAYSLLQTGKDEYGRTFPVSFQSFGDWKLPLYMYVTTLSVKLLGLSEIAVRLPSTLAGLGTVALSFFLVRQLFHNTNLAFLTMLLVAISPWHIHLSRVESESNVAVFLTTLAVFLFLTSMRGKHMLLIVSSLFFALTYFTYHGNHIFTTLLLIGIFLIYKDSIPRTKHALIAILTFTLLVGFILSQTLLSANKTKLSGISIFADPAIIHAKIELPRNEHEDPQGGVAQFFHNRVFFATERFVQNYINAFSPEFLFLRGGENRAHNIPNFGNMYLVEAPFLLLGLTYLLLLKTTKEKKLVFLWLLISPIASSITKDAPHTNRLFVMFPMLPLVTAMGVNFATTTLSTFASRKTVVGILGLLFVANIGMYLDRYYVHFKAQESQYWGIGYKKLVQFLESESVKDREVVMSKPETSPYIFLLFYQRYDPKKYQETAIRYPPTEDGFLHVRRFDRYEFRAMNWATDLASPNRLLIDVPSNIPESVRKQADKITEIEFPKGKPLFVIVQTK